jgi:hypothetical protein
MKSFNKDMKNGYNKFRKTINNSNVFRKTANTIDKINNFAIPVLTTASLLQPALAPVFGSTSAALKGFQMGSNKLKRIKL